MTIQEQLSESVKQDSVAVALVTPQTAIEVFSGGLEAALNSIAEKARAEVIDISTEKGRKACASLAYRIARSKTLIDESGKKLGEDARKQIAAINLDRNKANLFLDNLKDEVRQPLTEWEQADEKRVKAFEAKIAEITEAGKYTLSAWQKLPLEAMRDRLREIESDATNWQEFDARAKRESAAAKAAISEAIALREKYDTEQSELIKLRAEAEQARIEKAAREQKEREEAIAAAAAEKAKADAEAKAKREAEAAERKAEAQRVAAEREKQLVEQRAKDAERARAEAEERAEKQKQADARRLKESEEKAQQDRILAERSRAEALEQAARKAEADRTAAVEAERARVAAEQKAKAEADAQREADTKHKAKINNAALLALHAIGISEVDCKKVLVAIAKGEIPNVRIVY